MNAQRVTIAALVAIMVICSGTRATAQAPVKSHSANASKHGIAVVDMTYIFKEYKDFRSQMDGLKASMTTIESQIKAKRESILKVEQKRATYKPGSAEFKKIDEQIARSKSNFAIEMQKERRDFMEKEAKIYYSTYTIVNKAVQYYARNNNIVLVLRYDGNPIDPDRREDVLRGINKPIVYQGSIDITGEVLSLLNRAAVARTNNARPAAR